MTLATFYVICFAVGLVLSVISFLSGFENVTMLEHLFGGRGHIHHGGGAVHHGHGAHHHQLPGKHGHARGQANKAKVSPLNMATITAFLTWFGGAGIVLQRTTELASLPLAGVAGGIGLVGGAMVNRFIAMLVRSERTAPSLTMTGTIAKVTMPIREAGGTGEIVYTVGGTRQVAGARSDSGRGIDKGTEVVVMRHERGIAYVCTWDELAPEEPSAIAEVGPP